ncbi:MAG TPA: carboxypeptidase regulatory-like domain-containing protein [Terriglobia bacterium]|nr:carboxypeptidase regulatory-like domain-containing protein [Candidatus Acidoferrales bacterium]HEV2234735.1 carboxypeptidase regulatory-like domain-containing protein [Terriglobia bacterium]
MKRASLLFVLAIFCAAFFISSGTAWGQATTSLRGAVTDPSNSVIPNATVHLVNIDTNLERTTATNEQGSYVFAEVLPGHYRIEVDAAGFSKYEQKGFQLLVNSPATINVKMKIGAATQTVTVTEQAPLLNTTDASQGTTMTADQIDNLPLDARDVTQLLTLQPGVVFTSNRGDMASNDTRSGSVNGARSDQNNITLDGVDVNDQGNGAPFATVVPVTVASVEEFRVTTSNFGADQGRSEGAQEALVTRGGTNKFHGSAYEFNRSSFGEANDFFNKTSEQAAGQPNKPLHLVRNIYGGTFGGPIKHDRLFFFANFEGHRQAEAASVGRSIPSPTLANGIVQYPCAQVTVGGNSVPNPACVNPPAVIGADGTSFTPASGNYALGPAQLKAMDPLGIGPSPSSLAYFQSYYANKAVVPNDTTEGDGLNLNFDGFRFGASQHIRQDIAIARIDYKLNSSGSQTLFWRGSGEYALTPGTPLLPGGTPTTSDSNFSKGFVLGYTNVLRPTLINNFRFGYTRQSVVNAGDSFLPFNGVRQLSQDEGNYGTGFNFPVSNITDDLSWTKGNHTFSFGTNITLVRNASASTTSAFSSGSTNAAWLNVGGFANRASPFSPNFACPGPNCFPAVDSGFNTGYDFPLIGLLGMVTEVNAQYNNHVNSDGSASALAQGTPVQRNFALHESELYFNDSYKIRPNLTFTYGLRYEQISAPWETNGQQVAPSFDLGAWFAERGAGMANGVPANQFPNITFDVAGRSNHRPDWWPTGHNFAPRLSLAWSPEPSADWLKRIVGDDKTAIRAGFGMYYDHFGQSMILTFDQSGGEFGLATNLSNPAQVESAQSSPRWQPISGQPLTSAVNNIPTKDNNGTVIFTPAPAAGFPTTFPPGNFCICWGLDSSLKTPYSYALDFSVARELPHNMSVEVAYIGRLGHRLLVQSDLAQPLNLTDPASKITYYQAAKVMATLGRANGGNGTDPATVTSASIGPTAAYWQNLFSPVASGDQYNAGALISNTVANQQCGFNPATQAGFQISPTTDPVTAIYQTYLCTANNETSALDFFDVAGIPSLNTSSSYFAKTGQYTWFDNQFSSLFAWRSQSFSTYNAMQVTLRKQMSQGLQFNVNYTYSTSFDLASDAESVGEWNALSGNVVNPWMGNQLSGPSDFDLRHQINAQWVWSLPFGEGRPLASHIGKGLDAVIGGWQLSGITRWSSGFPVSAATCFCFPTNWQLTGLASAANRISGGHFNVRDQGGTLTYNIFKNPAAAFNDVSVPLPGESGSRNPFRGDGVLNTDMELNKTWKMPYNENHSLRLTADMFNVFNIKRFDVQSLQLGIDHQGAFGDYQRLLTNPRIMQFGLLYSF